MDFNAIIAELRASSENLPNESADRSLLSSVYCNKACKALDRIVNTGNEYENVITGLWLVAAHFAEQLPYLKPVPALSELCFKLFRQCAKAVLNIQWQNLEEDNSVRQNFLVSLANLHAKLIPFDFPRFRLLEALTENPWTNPTLAKVMGGEIEEDERDEVRSYIEQEDPIILQLRVDMMLKENCEEYALNLCHSCLTHPELQSDLSLRKTQLSLLYKQGQEDKLQEECQKLSIQDAVRIINQLQTSKPHTQICTVLAQTFMVQNWIRPSDMEANKELLRLWIRHQLLVDKDEDQFKDSVWAMAKLSQSTEQIVIFIDVLREECGNTYLQLYVDVCIFAINVDKGQMETSLKEGNIEAAAARRCDMSSICAKLACLCHHASVKVARMCALTSFTLKPTEESFSKIGTFYGQGGGCCNKCGLDKTMEPGSVNPATLYEVERLLNMLRPEYLNPESTYANIQILCRRFLHESVRHSQQKKQLGPQNSTGVPLLATTQVEGPGKKKAVPPAPNRPANVFEALTIQDVQNSQSLLQKMRLQDISASKALQSKTQSYSSGNSKTNILQRGQQSPVISGQSNKVQYLFDVEKAKSKQPYGVPLEQQHQFYMQKHEKDLERRRENALKKKEVRSPLPMPVNPSTQKKQNQPFLPQQQQALVQTQQRQMQSKQVTDIIQSALRQDSNALKRLTQGASPEVLQAVLSIMKGNTLKSNVSQNQQQPPVQQGQKASLTSQQGAQPLPTVSTLLKPPQQTQPQVYREQPPPRRHPRPQLYAQPIIVSTSGNFPSNHRPQPSNVAQSNNINQGSQSTSAASPVVTSAQKQKVENMLIAKSHVEGIRRFMQMQMSNIQQKNISETLQMSGSTVTLNNPVSIRSPTQLHNLGNRPKTTVEMAEQAALANLQKQQQAKQGVFPQQTKISQNQVGPSPVIQPKSNQPQLLSNINKPSSVSQQLKQQLQLHQQQQNNSSSLNAFPNNQTSAQNQNLALPSSDELSGSIMGIDESIIKELLQDSGILANTFPDIEVDSIGDDKSKRMPEPSLVPTLSSSRTAGLTGQQYCYSDFPNVARNKTSVLQPSAQMRNNTAAKTYMQASRSLSSSSVSHTLGSAIATNPPSQTSSHLSNSTKVELFSGANKLPNTPTARQTLSSQIPSIQQLAANTKTNILTRDSINLLPKKEYKYEDKPTVDQLREMMKKEDIQGEICMDAANNATYRCIICSLAFETLDNLREHVRNVCKPGLQSSSVYNTKIKQDRANSAKAGLETTTVFQCLRCFELCVSDAGIKQHRLTCKRVPTIPSDIQKEGSSKSKAPSKQPVVKKEYQDNSYKVPEIPLPFPHPSLSQDALLKRMSTAGSVNKIENSITTSSINSRNQSLTTTSSVGSRPTTIVNLNDNLVNSSSLNINNKPPASNVSSSFPNKLITPISTSSSLSKPPLPVTTTSVYSKSQAPITVSSFNGRSPMHATVLSNNPTPHVPVPVTTSATRNQNNVHETNISVPQTNMNVSQTNIKVPPERIEATIVDLKVAEKTEKKPKELPPPKYLEISGSGGSKFTRCKLCSQTLCSYESFLVHWQECAVKNERLLKRLLFKEKEANAKPLTGELLQGVLDVIAAVAVGDTCLPENKDFDAELSDAESELMSLRDPCKSPEPEPYDSEDRSGYSTTNESSEQQLESEDAENRDSDEGRYEDRVQHINKRGRRYEDDGTEGDSYSTTGKESGDDEVTYKKRKKKYAEEIEEENDEEDEDNSSSGSEQGGSFVSTREAPPRLRDRKTLKPIQSFINETFVSSYSNRTLRSKSEENARLGVGKEKEKRATSVSEVESDEESLICKVCKTPYQTKRILLQHYAGKHLQPYTVKTVADSSSYFCHLCQKTFSTFMHYMQHVPNHAVTIYEKMKAFTASRSSSRSERIASQRGCSKKSISPKQAKALKSKKSAVDRLKQKLLSGRTQSVRERILLSKKRRPLTRRFISSEEDYSSDASNNVVFKSKRPIENQRKLEGEKPKRGRGRPRKIENYNESSGDSSSSCVVTNTGSQSSKKRDVADNADADHNLDRSSVAHTTRSRKRSGQKLDSHVKSKRRNWESDTECVSEEVTSENGDEDQIKKSRETTKVIMDDFDTDSNSTTLILSQQDNGNFMPVFDNAEHKNDNDEPVTDPPKPVEDGVDPQHPYRVTVRSLSKRQKERLKSCDLHPTVVLQMLAPEHIDNSKRSASNRTHDSVNSMDKQALVQLDGGPYNDLDESGNTANVKVTTSATSTTKNSSFLDSFLSYLNQYPSPSSDRGITSPCKQSSSGRPGSVKQLKRRNSWESRSLSSDQGGSPPIRSRSSSGDHGSLASTDPCSLADTEGSTISYCTNPDKDSHHDWTLFDHSASSETGDQQKESVQSLLSRFPTRRCSVNLGQKINPNDLSKAVGEKEGQDPSTEKSLSSTLILQPSPLTALGQVGQASLSMSLAAKILPELARTVPVVALDRTELAKYLHQGNQNKISQASESLKQEISISKISENTATVDQSKKGEGEPENTSNTSSVDKTLNENEKQAQEGNINNSLSSDHTGALFETDLQLQNSELAKTSTVSSSEKNLTDDNVSKENTTNILETTHLISATIPETENESVENCSSNLPISDCVSFSDQDKNNSLQQNYVTAEEDVTHYDRPDTHLQRGIVASVEVFNENNEHLMIEPREVLDKAVEKESWPSALEEAVEVVSKSKLGTVSSEEISETLSSSQDISGGDSATIGVGSEKQNQLVSTKSSHDDSDSITGNRTDNCTLDQISEERGSVGDDNGNLPSDQKVSEMKALHVKLIGAEVGDSKETEQVEEVRIAEPQADLLELRKKEATVTVDYSFAVTPDNIVNTPERTLASQGGTENGKTALLDLDYCATKVTGLNPETMVQQKSFSLSGNELEKMTHVDMQCASSKSGNVPASETNEQPCIEVNLATNEAKEICTDKELGLNHAESISLSSAPLENLTGMSAAPVLDTGEQMAKVVDPNVHVILNSQIQDPVQIVDEVPQDQDMYVEKETTQLQTVEDILEKGGVHTHDDIDNKSLTMHEKLGEEVLPSWGKPNESKSDTNSRQPMTDILEVMPQNVHDIKITKPVESEIEAVSEEVETGKKALETTNESEEAEERNSPIAVTKNPAFSLAAFIAERILKEEDKSKREGELSSLTSRSDIIALKDSVTVSDSEDAAESNEVDPLNEGLGLVDYSSSDDDEDKDRDNKPDTDFKQGFDVEKENVSLGRSESSPRDPETEHEAEDGQSSKDMPSSSPINKLVVLSNFHYSHSVFIPSTPGNIDSGQGNTTSLEEKVDTDEIKDTQPTQFQTAESHKIEHLEKLPAANAESEDILVQGNSDKEGAGSEPGMDEIQNKDSNKDAADNDSTTNLSKEMFDELGMVNTSTVNDKIAVDEYDSKNKPISSDVEHEILTAEIEEGGLYLTADKQDMDDPSISTNNLEKIKSVSPEHALQPQEASVNTKFLMLEVIERQSKEPNDDKELEHLETSSENSYEDDIRLLSPDPQPEYNEDVGNDEKNLCQNGFEMISDISIQVNASSVESDPHGNSVSEEVNKETGLEQSVEPANASVFLESSVNVTTVNTEHIDEIYPDVITRIAGSVVVEESCIASEGGTHDTKIINGPVEKSGLEAEEGYEDLNAASLTNQETEESVSVEASFIKDMPEKAGSLLTEAKQQEGSEVLISESEDSAKDEKKDPAETCEDLSKEEPEPVSESSQAKKSTCTLQTENAQSLTTESKAAENENGDANTNVEAKDVCTEKQSKNEEKLTEIDEDGDDLSDFDLVIEKDTSSRNLVPLLSTYVKKRTVIPQSVSSAYITQTEQVSTPTGLKTVKIAGAKPYRNIHVVVEKPTPQMVSAGPGRRKQLGGAKSLRKDSQEQFVWEDDDDDHKGGTERTVTQPIPVLVNEVNKTVSEATEKKILLRKFEKNTLFPCQEKKSPSQVAVKNQNSPLELVERKRKALRDMTETAPFTWDLEESPDKPSQSLSSNDTTATTGGRKSVRNTPLNPEAKKERLTSKPAERIIQKRRPLTPDVGPPTKRPAKVKRARSVEKQSNFPIAMTGNESSENITVKEKEDCTGEGNKVASTRSTEDIQNSITIDEEISFKKDSFPSPLNSEAASSPVAQDSPASSIGDSGLKSGRGRPRRNPLPGTTSKNEGRKDGSMTASTDLSEEVLWKSQPMLRSRHSSMDSNKSDKSISSKRSSNSSPQAGFKRIKKNEDKLTPKLKKAGLIKITKNSNSLATQSSGIDLIAPMTRSSEAAKKAFNQKSLRNRGVNPLDTALSSASPTSKYSTAAPSPKISPVSPLSKTSSVNSLLKSNSETNSKVRGQAPSIHKLSPTSSKHPPSSQSVPSTTAEESTRTSKKFTESYNSNSTAAVVKRRSPTASVPLRRSAGNKTTSGRHGNRPNSAKTTVYLVDPVPSTPTSRGSSKSHAGAQIKTSTIHTTLPPGTTPTKTKKTDNGKKQSKWKIKKETKLATSRKRQKGPISFKRA